MRRIRCGRRGTILAVAAVALAAGGSLLGVGVAAQQSAPQPPAAIAGAPVTLEPTTPATVVPNSAPSASSSGASSSAPAGTASSWPASRTPSSSPFQPPHAGAAGGASRPAGSGQQRRVAWSAPVSLSIPAIGVQASFVQLGLNADGTIQVPSDVRHVGWYRLGPAPGEVGPAVVLGHVDSAAAGTGVFFRLGALSAGDTVSITLADGGVVTFHVYAVREYPKDAFPTQTVYGNTTDAQLRLITCGGSFDHASGHYRNNIVIFARQT